MKARDTDRAAIRDYIAPTAMSTFKVNAKGRQEGYHYIATQWQCDRALAQNRDAAASCGINVIASERIAVSAAVALVSLIGMTTPTVGHGWVLDGFVVGILGGLGSVAGALVGLRAGLRQRSARRSLGAYHHLPAALRGDPRAPARPAGPPGVRMSAPPRPASPRR
ncbi:MAG: hypothetical protein IT561_25170 [Alphaproteobacteria bacterium]|nr:hypothetical protein [Alphaproteobacteria bacterium]